MEELKKQLREELFQKQKQDELEKRKKEELEKQQKDLEKLEAEKQKSKETKIEPSVKYCSNCLTENPIYTKFCVECGKDKFENTLKNATTIFKENQRILLQQNLEKERQEKEKLRIDKLEKTRLESERLEKEKQEKDKKAKIERERLKREKLESEKLEKERLQKAKLESERLEKERLQKAKLEREKLENERLQREKLENERLEKERLESERQENEKKEKERPEKEKKTLLLVKNDILKRDKNAIYFGSYPQTIVTNENLITTLNNQAGQPNIENDWKDYNYYINNKIESFMYYKDVIYNNEKYRGVYFKSYRPRFICIESSIQNADQKNNKYKLKTIFWFKFEPIKWQSIKDEKGEIFISKSLLDSQDFYINLENRKEKDKFIFPNNYEHSHIRQWLNKEFYETAFSNTEKSIIKTTLVDNSASTTSSSINAFACNDTQDKVFLLSYTEVKKYFETNDLSKKLGTDYAKCQGLWVNGNKNSGGSFWWLRSPYVLDKYGSMGISSDGSKGSYDDVYRINSGICPVIKLVE